MAPQRSTQRHLEITREAGLGRISWLSILAGLVTAYGAAALVAAVVGSLLARAGVDTEFRSNDWTGSGAAAALATAVTLFIAYLFGGYVAGRMARRAGLLHGVLVFVASIVVAAIAGGIVAVLANGQEERDMRSNLRNIGIPTSTDQLKAVAITGAIVSLAAILLGAIVGGILGERWHTKLARRAADPEVGPAADMRERAAHEDDQRHERVAQDRLVRRDLEGDDDGDSGNVGDRRDDGGWDAGEPPRTSSGTDTYATSSSQGGASAIDADEPRLTEREWREREGR